MFASNFVVQSKRDKTYFILQVFVLLEIILNIGKHKLGVQVIILL